MNNMSWERRREASTARPCQPATSPHAEPESRFRRLLGDEDWHKPGGLPQVICSIKQFAGPTQGSRSASVMASAWR
jgi:hypothetical protein